MINQKGQAFSVFELMIAGVVAFAILMVLLQVIGGITKGTDSDALTAISNAVSSASPSGQAFATPFILKKDVAVMVTNLASKTDLDKDSFIFTKGEFVSDTDEIEVAEDGTWMKYTGAKPQKKISAVVVCEQTNSDLSTALDMIEASTPTKDVAIAKILPGCKNDGIVCCVIVPTKAAN